MDECAIYGVRKYGGGACLVCICRVSHVVCYAGTLLTHTRCADPLLFLFFFGTGKVFVEYDAKESAQKAALSLAGRQFGQNIVKVEYVNEEKFARRDFD